MPTSDVQSKISFLQFAANKHEKMCFTKANVNPNLFIPSNPSKASQCPKGNDYMQLKCKLWWADD